MDDYLGGSDTNDNALKIRNSLMEVMLRGGLSVKKTGGYGKTSIKSIKTHLYRVLGECYLTYDELNTIIIKIEAVLNSCPLYSSILRSVEGDPINTSTYTFSCR